jgi:hypothetical protein
MMRIVSPGNFPVEANRAVNPRINPRSILRLLRCTVLFVVEIHKRTFYDSCPGFQTLYKKKKGLEERFKPWILSYINT